MGKFLGTESDDFGLRKIQYGCGSFLAPEIIKIGLFLAQEIIKRSLIVCGYMIHAKIFLWEISSTFLPFLNIFFYYITPHKVWVIPLKIPFKIATHTYPSLRKCATT